MTSALTVVTRPATASAAARPVALGPRCTIGMRHYRRSFPFAPSPQAAAGALDIYREGERNGDIRRMLFGLSVLRSASETQLQALLGGRDIASPADRFGASAQSADESAPAAATSL